MSSMSRSRFPGSTWATWPLVVGIAIPIAGVAILSMLGIVFYLQHRRLERGSRPKDQPYHKDHDLERSSESSGSSTSHPSDPAFPTSSIIKPCRPSKLRTHTAEHTWTISKDRLSTIQEYKHSSLEWNFPMPPVTRPEVEQIFVTTDRIDGAWLANQLLQQQDTVRDPTDRAERALHRLPLAESSYALPNPAATNNFELDIMWPTMQFRQEYLRCD